jgi:putative peptidoglycan lipid II flippase
MVGLNIVLNLTLINFLGEAGLAWSTSICATLQAVLLMHIFQRNHIRSIVDREVGHSICWSILLSIIMAGAVVGATLGLRAVLDAEEVSMLLLLIVQSGSGGLAYAITARVARPAELRWALGSERD